MSSSKRLYDGAFKNQDDPMRSINETRDAPRHLGHHVAVVVRADWMKSTLGERMRWAMQRVSALSNELAQMAGVSKGTTSRLANSTERAEGTVDTMLRLATALDVSPAWLAFGLGSPLDDTRTPNRDLAARLCLEYGVCREAVDSVMGEVIANDGDLPVITWIDRMRLRELELKAAR